MSRKFTASYSTIALYGNNPETSSDDHAVKKSMGHNEPEEKVKPPEHISYWVKETTTDIKMPDTGQNNNESSVSERADQLKQQYNEVLKQYNEIEDGSYAIASDPVYMEINWLLRVLAQSIANVLEIKPEDSIRPVAEVQELLGGELVTGFK